MRIVFKAMPQNLDYAVIRLDQRTEYSDERALACSVWIEQTEKLPLSNFK